jgi:hypothetical protein
MVAINHGDGAAAREGKGDEVTDMWDHVWLRPHVATCGRASQTVRFDTVPPGPGSLDWEKDQKGLTVWAFLSVLTKRLSPNRHRQLLISQVSFSFSSS